MQKSESVSRFFDNYASEFQDIYGSEYNLRNRIVNHYFRASMRLRFEKTIEGCFPIEGMTVLDVGCGPGHYSTNLALRGAQKVVGLDFAQEMTVPPPGMITLACCRTIPGGGVDHGAPL